MITEITALQDLRGLQRDNISVDRYWCELVSVLYCLVTVTTLYIGSCPLFVVHSVGDHMVWLQHFSAENIDDTDWFSFFLVAVVY